MPACPNRTAWTTPRVSSRSLACAADGEFTTLVHMDWLQAGLWGLAGAAVNRTLIFLEANRRVKGMAWRYPEGPGGGFFALATALHCSIGAIVSAATAQSGYVSNAVVALGVGASAPVVMKSLSRMALAALPATNREGDDQ
jgi:hypothetical protein